MSRQSLALNQIQLLLGHYATDDTLWRDLRLFETTALPMITTVWELDQVEDGMRWHILHPRDEAARALHAQRIAEIVDQIAATLGTAASACAAALFFNP